MELQLGFGLILFHYVRTLPLPWMARIGLTLSGSFILASLVGTVLSTIARFPWLLIVLPILLGGLGIGGLYLWKRYGPKIDNPFQPY